MDMWMRRAALAAMGCLSACVEFIEPGQLAPLPPFEDSPAGVTCVEVETVSAWVPVAEACLPRGECTPMAEVDEETGQVVRSRHLQDGPYGPECVDCEASACEAHVAPCLLDASGRVEASGEAWSTSDCEFALCSSGGRGTLNNYYYDALGNLTMKVGLSFDDELYDHIEEYFWDEAGRFIGYVHRWCEKQDFMVRPESPACDWISDIGRFTYDADGTLSSWERGGEGGISDRETLPGRCPAAAGE